MLFSPQPVFYLQIPTNAGYYGDWLDGHLCLEFSESWLLFELEPWGLKTSFVPFLIFMTGVVAHQAGLYGIQSPSMSIDSGDDALVLTKEFFTRECHYHKLIHIRDVSPLTRADIHGVTSKNSPCGRGKSKPRGSVEEEYRITGYFLKADGFTNRFPLLGGKMSQGNECWGWLLRFHCPSGKGQLSLQ